MDELKSNLEVGRPSPFRRGIQVAKWVLNHQEPILPAN